MVVLLFNLNQLSGIVCIARMYYTCVSKDFDDTHDRARASFLTKYPLPLLDVSRSKFLLETALLTLLRRFVHA